MDAEESIISGGVPEHGFLYTPNDNNHITDPDTGEVTIASTLTTKTDGLVTVKYRGSSDPVTIQMFGGVRRSMRITKVLVTDTDSQIVSDGVVLEY